MLDSELEAEPGYPQSIARDWLVCSDMQADAPEAAGSSRVGARSKPGQHDQSRSENSYEVCSCTSASVSPSGDFAFFASSLMRWIFASSIILCAPAFFIDTVPCERRCVLFCSNRSLRPGGICRSPGR